MDSILGMALQLPALKSIGESIGVDLSAAVGRAERRTAAAAGLRRQRRRCRRADADSQRPAAIRRITTAGEDHVVLTSSLPRLGLRRRRRQRAAVRHALAQGAPIKLGSVLDNSGNLDIYGKPMVHGDARSRSRRSTPPAACSAARSS